MDESYLQRQGTLSRRTFLKLSVGALLLLAGCDVGRGAPRIGLALGGGGAKGLAHIPMLTVLDEMGVRPYRIAGTSIGAIIGALYASGLSGAEIRALVEQFLIKKYPEVQTLISLPKSWRWLDFVDPEIDRGGLLNSSDFIKFLGEILPVKSFNKLKVSLTVVAAEFWSGKQVVLDSGDILPALEASMALPGIFLPVELNGRKLVDGGVVNPLPYDLLMEECDLVIAIDVSGSRFNESENGPSFIGVLFHSFHTMGQNLVAERLKQQRPHIYIRPDIRDVRTLEFYKAKQVFDQSQPAARQLARILKSRLS